MHEAQGVVDYYSLMQKIYTDNQEITAWILFHSLHAMDSLNGIYNVYMKFVAELLILSFYVMRFAFECVIL